MVVANSSPFLDGVVAAVAPAFKMRYRVLVWVVYIFSETFQEGTKQLIGFLTESLVGFACFDRGTMAGHARMILPLHARW